jgi:hypothetical protein
LLHPSANNIFSGILDGTAAPGQFHRNKLVKVYSLFVISEVADLTLQEMSFFSLYTCPHLFLLSDHRFYFSLPKLLAP